MRSESIRFLYCPKCGDSRRERTNTEIEGGTLWFDYECPYCGTTWSEEYEFVTTVIEEDNKL